MADTSNSGSSSSRSGVYDDLRVVYNELRQEINLIGKVDGEGGIPEPLALSQPERRVLVRSISAFVEAIANLMKYTVLHSGLMTEPEKALLADQSYVLESNGTAGIRKAKLSTLANVQFAFKAFAKSKEVTFSLDTSGKEWQLLQHTTRLRDRLMHPHSVADLEVSDEDIIAAVLAYYWFHIQFHNLLTTTAAVLAKRAKAEGTSEQ